jgi:hypothetical protein
MTSYWRNIQFLFDRMRCPDSSFSELLNCGSTHQGPATAKCKRDDAVPNLETLT